MTMSLRERPGKAVIPLVCALLIVLLAILQFLAMPQVLGTLQSLAPPETSSPRATLEGFRANTAGAAILLMQAYNQNKSDPGFFWSEDVTQKVAEAEALLARAARTLDLRDIPPVELEHRRLESTLLLKEILDRVPLPDPDAIPDKVAVSASPIPVWNVPNTEIRIVRMADGVRAGEYLFSSGTVQQLEEFYRLIRKQPNLSGATDDFYDFFVQSPGHLLPPKWYTLIEALPAPLRARVYGQAVWQWIGLALVTALAGLGVLAVRNLVHDAEQWGTTQASVSAYVALPGAVAVAALFVRYMAVNQINLIGAVNDGMEQITQGIAYLAMIWGIMRFSSALGERLTLSMSKGIDAHLARASIRFSGIAVGVVLLVYGASYLGIPLGGLLAGLGVGGLAVALAAKPTIENFIGGLILYADRPVRVGDLCRFGDLEGRVEEIGLRSTRIRGLDRTLISIPNATFVNMDIINLTNRDRMPYERTIGLGSIDSNTIRHQIEALAAIVAAHPKIEAGSLKTRLREGQEENPKVEICALILTSAWDDFLRIQQEIDLMLRDRILASRPQDAGAPNDAGNVYPLKEAVEVEKAQLTGL